MSFLDNLQWRFASKEFDNTKRVPKEDLEKILDSIQYSPSSYGLQPYHIYIISDAKLKAKIKVAAFLQKQITSCSELIVFCAMKDNKNLSKRVDEYINLATKNDKIAKLKMQPVKLMMKGTIKKMDTTERSNWAAKQCYINLGFAMAAAAELKIDSCPMEGFDKKSVNKILNLSDNLESVVMLPIGYRKEEPKRKKVRFSKEDLFTNL